MYPMCQSNIYVNRHICTLTSFLAYNRHVNSFIYFHQWCSWISSSYLCQLFDWITAKRRNKLHLFMHVHYSIYRVLLTPTASTSVHIRSYKLSNSLSAIAIGSYYYLYTTTEIWLWHKLSCSITARYSDQYKTTTSRHYDVTFVCTGFVGIRLQSLIMQAFLCSWNSSEDNNNGMLWLNQQGGCHWNSKSKLYLFLSELLVSDSHCLDS